MPKRRNPNLKPRFCRPLPDDGPARRTDELVPFAKWLKRVPLSRLTSWLQTMLWHGQLQGSELYRAFIVEHYKDINMVPENNAKPRARIVKK